MNGHIRVVIVLLVAKICFGTTTAIAREQFLTKADSLNSLSKDLYLKEPSLARQHATEALIVSKKAGYERGIGISFKLIGASYWAQSYYPTSIFYLKSALPYLQNDATEHARCLGLLGRVYADMHDFAEADSLLETAASIKNIDTATIVYILTEQSMSLRAQKKFTKSLLISTRALALAEQVQKKQDIAIITSRIFSLYLDTGQFDKANEWYPKAISLSLGINNKRLTSSNYISRSFYYRQLMQYDSAVFYANKGLQLADTMGVIDMAGNACKNLYKTYEAKGDTAMALSYYKKYQAYQDTLNAQTRRNSFIIMEDFSALNNKLAEIGELKKTVAEKSNKLRIRGTTIGVMAVYIALLMAVLIVTAYLYTHIKLLNTKLQKHNAQILERQTIIDVQAENLQKLNMSKDKLLGIIGHDLKTPINNIKALIDIFEHGLMGPDELQMVMKDMGQAVHAADLTLANLVKWSQSQLDSNEMASQPVDVGGMAGETKKIFEYQLKKKNLQFEFEIATTAKARANENHFKAILNNLISNAIKFTPVGGYIGVKAYQQNEMLMVEVKDTGKGMMPEEIDNLFKSTSLFTTNGTNGEKGTGIGLLLCHELVNRNAGKIWVNSLPGQGSTFYLSLPACEN